MTTLQTLIDTAELPDPNCWVATPTRSMLDPLSKSWTYGGDSLKHYGDEWTRSDGATLILTYDSTFLLGLYANIHAEDETESFTSSMWSTEYYEDILAILPLLGVDTLPQVNTPTNLEL